MVTNVNANSSTAIDMIGPSNASSLTPWTSDFANGRT